MAIETNFLIAKASKFEYAVMTTTPSGVSELFYLDKDFDKISDFIRGIVEFRTSPYSGSDNYTVLPNTDQKNPNFDISVVTITPHLISTAKTGEQLWKSKTWSEAYFDFTLNMYGMGGYTPRKFESGYRYPQVVFSSFVEFFRKAYPVDAAVFSLADPGFKFMKKQFQLPLTS